MCRDTHDGSMQNVENWGHSTRECEDWTVCFTPVKYEDGNDANADEEEEASQADDGSTQNVED